MAISAELGCPNTAEQNSIAQKRSSSVRAQIMPLHHCSTAWHTAWCGGQKRHAASASIQSIMWHMLTCSIGHQSETEQVWNENNAYNCDRLSQGTSRRNENSGVLRKWCTSNAVPYRMLLCLWCCANGARPGGAFGRDGLQ